MDSPYYDRLQAVAGLQLDDFDERRCYTGMLERLRDTCFGVKKFAQNLQETLRGQAGDAAVAAITSILEDMTTKLTDAVAPGWEKHTVAWEAMWKAKTDFADLATQLTSPGLVKLVTAAQKVVLPDGGVMSALDYLFHVEDYNNRLREQQAKQILDTMNGTVGAVVPPWLDVEPTVWVDPGTSSGGGSKSRNEVPKGDSTGGGSSGGQGSTAFPVGWVPDGTQSGSGGLPGTTSPSLTPGAGVTSGWIPDSTSPDVFSGTGLGGSPASGAGSGGSSGSDAGVSAGWPSGSTSPDPFSGTGLDESPAPEAGFDGSDGSAWGVMPVLVTLPNGSMAGVVPAPVLNPDATSWKVGYSSTRVVPLTLNGAVVDGWAGTDASRMMGGTGSGAGGMDGAGGASRFGSSLGGASGAGIGSARTAGTMGAGGAGIPGAAGPTGGAGAAGTGSRGGMMAPGAGAGASKEEKLKRRKYKVFKFRADRDPEDWGEMPEAAGAGCAEDLKPLYTEEDDEYWLAPRRPRGSGR